MSYLFYRVSTWLVIELVATSILVGLNMVIPALMSFGSYRSIVNFYFSSAALSSSLLNCLYIYYLVQTLRTRGLSENNCRAIYYLQTSCTVVLAYTITAMHANFVLCLLSSSSPGSSDRQHSTRTALQSCGHCLRRFFRRFWFCLVLLVWSLSFTATIPLLYTIDSNEKAPKPVYCPGTKQISYLEEWFDSNRLVQSLLFNLIPLLITLFLSLIALCKLFYDCLVYVCLRIRISKCSPCRQRYLQRQQQQQPHQQQQQQQQQQPGLPLHNSVSMLSSLGIVSNSNIHSGTSLAPVNESPTPTSETTDSSTNFPLQSCGRWCSSSFLRFILVLSCCLLACIYPIAMRFYLVYFSVLVPLIFAVLNYSLGQLTPSPQQPSTDEPMQMDNRTMVDTVDVHGHRKSLQRHSSLRRERACLHEEFELHSPVMSSNLPVESDGLDEQEQFLVSPSSSSQSSTLHCQSHRQPPLPPRGSHPGKQKYFSNNLYENYSRTTSNLR